MRPVAIERTLVFVKPDGVARGLATEILARFERKGFKLVGLKLVKVGKELGERHYAIHQGKPFYPGLIKFVRSGPVVAAVVEGEDAVAQCRSLMGPTDPKKGAPGQVRFDYGQEIGRNLIHGSDSPETARKEIALWFRPDELVAWKRADERWLFE